MEKRLLHLLIIDDSPDDAELATDVLRRAGYMIKSQRVQDLAGARSALTPNTWDVIVTEVDVPQITVPALLELLKRQTLDIPVVVMTGALSDEEMTSFMRAGVQDVIFKNHPGRLAPVVERELKTLAARRDQLKASEALRALEKKYRALVTGSHEAMCYCQDGMHVEANPAYLALFGYPDIESLQEVPLLNLIDTRDQARFKDYLRKPSADKGGATREFTAIRKDNARIPVSIAISSIQVGEERWQQITVADASRSKSIESKLQFLNQRDQLTGLYNRHYFLTELAKAVEQAKSGGAISALLGIDLPDVQTINDEHGFAAGDRLLIKLAKLFRDKVRDTDLLARLTGDEFAVLIKDGSTVQAEATAEAIRQAMKETRFTEGGKQYECTCEVNIVRVDKDVPSAQAALLKAHHRSKPEVVAPPPPPPPMPPLEIVEAPQPLSTPLSEPRVDPASARQIQAALTEGRFELLYQPIVNLHGRPSESYEVMVRMLDEQGTPITAGELFGTAEACGMSQAIDHWVIKRAIARLGEHRRTGAKTKFFINLSDSALQDSSLAMLVLDELKAVGLKGDCLVFEVRESTLLKQGAQASTFIESLRKLGCRFAVDDFGNNLSAYPQIQKLPIDFLKLDGCLINRLTDDNVCQAVVQALFQMAKAMERQVIAKFVEDAQCLTLLWNFGAEYVQGNYFQPPDTELNYEFATEDVDSDQAVAGWTRNSR